MSTLRKIFFMKFLKQWVGITLLGIFGLFLLSSLGPSGDSTLHVIITLYLLGAPIVHAGFMNNDFQHNLDWLINFQYNRKQLIKFYLFTQTTKLVLVSFTYFLFLVISIFIIKTKPVVASNPKVNDSSFFEILSIGLSSPSVLSIGLLGLFSGVFIIYVMSLITSNAEAQRRMEIRLETYKRKQNNGKAWYKNLSKKKIFIITIVAIIIHTGFLLNFYSFIVLGSSMMAAGAVHVLNMKFKLFPIRKENLISASFGAAAIVPYIFLFFGSVAEIKSNKTPPPIRVFALSLTSPYYSTDLSTFQDIVSMTKDCNDFKELGRYAGKKEIEPKYYLTQELKFCQYFSMLQGMSKQKSIGRYFDQTVKLTDLYIKKNNLSLEKQLRLAQAIYSGGVRLKPRKLNYLISQDGTFKKFLALKAANRSLGYGRKYKTFLRANQDQLSDEIKKIGSIKRSLASLNEKKKVKKKKENRFSYDDY